MSYAAENNKRSHILHGWHTPLQHGLFLLRAAQFCSTQLQGKSNLTPNACRLTRPCSFLPANLSTRRPSDHRQSQDMAMSCSFILFLCSLRAFEPLRCAMCCSRKCLDKKAHFSRTFETCVMLVEFVLLSLQELTDNRFRSIVQAFRYWFYSYYYCLVEYWHWHAPCGGLDNRQTLHNFLEDQETEIWTPVCSNSAIEPT